MEQMDLVSICLPTRNGEKYIRQALDSVKKQTYRNIELIISDDQSQDNTLAICEKFVSEVPFPVYIYHHKPNGMGANWNYCIEKSNGKYIKFLFQDDLLEENCIEKMLGHLQGSEPRVAFCKRKVIDEKGGVVSGKWLNNYGDLQEGAGFFFENLKIFKKAHMKLLGRKKPFYYNFAGEPITMLMEKELWVEVGPFNTHLQQLLDLEYAYRILLKSPILFISEKLVSFRHHADQMSSHNRKNNLDEGPVITILVYRKFFRYISCREKIKALKTFAKK